MSPSSWSWLVPLPVLLPLLGAALTLMASRSPAVQRAVSTTVLTTVVAVSVALVVLTDRHGPQVLWVGAWREPLGIALVADRLSALMLLVMSPFYLQSDWCGDEVGWFTAADPERAADGDLFVVRVVPTDEEKWPSTLRDEQGATLPGYRFHPAMRHAVWHPSRRGRFGTTWRTYSTTAYCCSSSWSE